MGEKQKIPRYDIQNNRRYKHHLGEYISHDDHLKVVRELEEEIENIRIAMNGYPDSNLASLATTLKRRNETLEALYTESESIRRDAIKVMNDKAELANDILAENKRLRKTGS